MENAMNIVMDKGPDIAIKLFGGIVLWLVGKWLIGVVMKLVNKGMGAKGMDATLTKYITSVLGIALKVILIVAILGYFGVDTTSFAALLAGAGMAIGMAWSGLLSNFAAGVFILILRPFKVGDFVTIGGVTGTIREIGIFVTAIDKMDNVRTIIGNKKAFEENIENFTTNPTRRVELKAQLAHGTDPKQAIQILQNRVAKIPNVATSPAPDIYVLEFNLAGPVLCVRPHTNNDHYWQVYFDTNAAIREEFGNAGFSTPQTHHVHTTRAA